MALTLRLAVADLQLTGVGLFILGFFFGGSFMFVVLAMFMAGRRGP